MSPAPSRHARGFTLIEVLVSLAIFALAAVVLSVAYLNIIGSYRNLGTRQVAGEDWKWLRSVVLAEPDRLVLEQGGDLPLPDGRQAAWQVTIEDTDKADLFRVTLEVDSPGGGDAEAWQRRESLYLFRPTWSDPVEREKLRDVTRQRVMEETL